MERAAHVSEEGDGKVVTAARELKPIPQEP